MDWSTSPTKAVPRSKLSVVMVTRQPSFSSPSRLATGTRTASRNNSPNSVEPAIVSKRPEVDAGTVHGQDQPGDTPVTAVLGPGPDEQLAEVRHLGVRGPDLLSRDDVLVPVALGPGPQRRQVAPRAGLGESLAPHLVAPEDGRQEPGPLFGGALHDHRRPGMEQADEVHPDIGRVGSLELLEVDELFDRARAPAPSLDGPVDARRTRRRRASAATSCRRRAGRASRGATASGAAWGRPRPATPAAPERKDSSLSE